ncbi:MAG: protein kinase domain-containing protein, partial [Nostoc sp.]
LGNEHDQIPRLFAHFNEDGDFYLVQQFIDGHALTQEIVPGQRLSENAVLNLLREILEVLAFVHQHNIIHRDIKPQNLMRRHTDQKIVLIDFGSIKKISALGAGLTIAVGTPGYMPSEQAKGKPKLCSDIYAVGMIGIQALTGLIPEQLQEDPNTGEVIWRDKAQVSGAL